MEQNVPAWGSYLYQNFLLPAFSPGGATSWLASPFSAIAGGSSSSNNNNNNNASTDIAADREGGRKGEGAGSRLDDKAGLTEDFKPEAEKRLLHHGHDSIKDTIPGDYFGSSWQTIKQDSIDVKLEVQLESPAYDTSAMFGLPPNLQPLTYPYNVNPHIFNPNRFQAQYVAQQQQQSQGMSYDPQQQQQHLAQQLQQLQNRSQPQAGSSSYYAQNPYASYLIDNSMSYSSSNDSIQPQSLERPSLNPLTVDPSSMHSHNSTSHVSSLLYPTSQQSRQGSGSSSRISPTSLEAIAIDDSLHAAPMSASPSLVDLDSTRSTPHHSPRAPSPKRLGKQRNKRRQDSIESEHDAEHVHSDMEHEVPEGVERDGMIWGMKVEDYRALSARERKRVRNRISARTFRAKRKEHLNSLESNIGEKDLQVKLSREEAQRLRREVDDLKRRLSKYERV